MRAGSYVHRKFRLRFAYIHQTIPSQPGEGRRLFKSFKPAGMHRAIVEDITHGHFLFRLMFQCAILGNVPIGDPTDDGVKSANLDAYFFGGSIGLRLKMKSASLSRVASSVRGP